MEQNGWFADHPTFIALKANRSKSIFIAVEFEFPIFPILPTVVSFEDGCIATDDPTMLGITGKSQILEIGLSR